MSLVNPSGVPPVTLDAAHAEQLQALALAALRSAPQLAGRLLDEIERATLVAPADVPADVVTIGSEVTFRDEASGRERSAILVLPADAEAGERRLSVVTPVGVALLGLACGASIRWRTHAGETRRLTVTAVRRGPVPAAA